VTAVRPVVDDSIEHFVRLMKSLKEITGPINPAELTILQLPQMAIKLIASSSKLTFEPLPQDATKQRQPNITLASEHFGWQSKVPLDHGWRTLIVC
jgi:UDP-glucuronate decarboxylase